MRQSRLSEVHMNKYTWIWAWRNTIVPELKGIFIIVVICLCFIALLP